MLEHPLPAGTTTQRDCYSYLLCPSFHGSTLIALLLNNHSELLALGDTFPDRRINQVCSCSERVVECKFWKQIAAAVGADRFEDCTNLIPILPELLPAPRANALLCLSIGVLARAVGRWIWTPWKDRLNVFFTTYRSFRSSVLAETGMQIWIDGFKHPVVPLAVESASNTAVAIQVVHLVRDPAAFVLSNRTRGARGCLHALLWWISYHMLVLFLYALTPRYKYLQVSYEDLCKNPDQEFDRILRFLNLKEEAIVGIPRFSSKNHLIGNQMLREYDGAVRLDERWRTELSGLEICFIRALTAPFCFLLSKFRQRLS